MGRGSVALWVGVRSSGGPTWWAGSCFKSGVSRVPVLSCEQFPGFFQGLLLVYVKRKQKQIIKRIRFSLISLEILEQVP